RWRAREEAVAAATGPKRREPMASGAGQQKRPFHFEKLAAYARRLLPNRRLSSFEGTKSLLTNVMIGI
ncbi:hypothetical protein, partial [Parageobacillus toebii]